MQAEQKTRLILERIARAIEGHKRADLTVVLPSTWTVGEAAEFVLRVKNDVTVSSVMQPLMLDCLERPGDGRGRGEG